MRRTQIYLDEQMDGELRQRAAAEGRSAAALIREALNAYLAQRSSVAGDEDPIRALAGKFRGLPADAAGEHDRDLYGRPAASKARRAR